MAKRGRGSQTQTQTQTQKKSVEGAEFFQVFIPNFKSDSHQLLIPPDFVKDFKKTMKEKAILKNIYGKTWLVDVKATSDGVFLEGGWRNFVDYHGLKVGDFLVFRYDGSYSFLVTIFGSNGCKKESFEPKNTPTRVKSEEETQQRASPQNEDHLPSVGRRTTRHSERFGEVNEEEEEGASEHPEKSKEFDDMDRVSPDCTSFFSLPGAHKSMKIPDEVMKKVNVRKDEGMFLRDEEGKEWPVKIYTLPDGSTYLGKGLHDFQVAKNVGPDKHCKFTIGTEISSGIINVQVLR